MLEPKQVKNRKRPDHRDRHRDQSESTTPATSAGTRSPPAPPAAPLPPACGSPPRCSRAQTASGRSRSRNRTPGRKTLFQLGHLGADRAPTAPARYSPAPGRPRSPPPCRLFSKRFQPNTSLRPAQSAPRRVRYTTPPPDESVFTNDVAELLRRCKPPQRRCTCSWNASGLLVGCAPTSRPPPARSAPAPRPPHRPPSGCARPTCLGSSHKRIANSRHRQTQSPAQSPAAAPAGRKYSAPRNCAGRLESYCPLGDDQVAPPASGPASFSPRRHADLPRACIRQPRFRLRHPVLHQLLRLVRVGAELERHGNHQRAVAWSPG